MRRPQDPSTPPAQAGSGHAAAQAPQARRRPHAWQPCLGEEWDVNFWSQVYTEGSTDMYISHLFGPGV